jgi:hypothetical protein
MAEFKIDLEEQDGCGLDSSGADRDQWRALINMVVKIMGPYNEGNFLTS